MDPVSPLVEDPLGEAELMALDYWDSTVSEAAAARASLPNGCFVKP